jgi:hypothetical protein
MMHWSVSGFADLRLSEKAMPTCEKRRSTAADDGGQPKYWRAMTATFGKVFSFSFHQLIASISVLNFI